MDVRIGIASLSLGAGFPGVMYGLLKKQLRPGQSLVECSMVLEKTPGHMRSRLLALLETAPRPTALIGISIRPDPGTLAAYRAAGVPVVLVDEEAEGASTVASDNFAGGLLAARHLLQTGRRALGVVSGLMHLEGGYNALQRVNGFRRGLAEGGLTLPPEHVIEVMNYSRKDGVDAMARLLDDHRPLDGVFCAAGDVCATGMLATAAVRNVRVPGQLALLGYDDNPVSAASDPPLSTIRQPLERIAREAYQLAAIEPAATLHQPRKVVLEPELVARASTQRLATTPTGSRG
jgi:LacI family transcriptional regulator